MKKTTLLFLFLFLALARWSQAQISIEFSDFASAGDTILLETDTLGMDEFVSFENIAQSPWDYSQFSVDTQDTLFVEDPALSQYADTFETANLIVPDSELGALFLEKTQEKVMLLGTAIELDDPPVALALAFVPPLTYLKFPSALDSTHTEESFAQLRTTPELLGVNFRDLGFPINPDSVRFDLDIQLESLIDAEGTLNSPEGEYEVVRQKLTVHNELRVYIYLFGGWAPEPVLERPDTILRYSFWAKEMRYPVLTLNVTNDSVRSVEYQTSEHSPVGLPQLGAAPDFRFFPTLATDRIIFQSTGNQVFSTTLFDAAGRVVWQGRWTGQVEIDPSAWPAGLYLQQTTSGNHTQTGKIILQKP